MSKILTLYDIELKRIKKTYLSLLVFLILSNLGCMIYSLLSIIKDVEKSLNIRGGMSLLRSNEAFKILQGGNHIYMIYQFTYVIMSLAILWCLYYALSIWYKDFYGKTKVAYTMFMLPFNKFNIYLSKLITVVVFIYGVIATQYLLWIIEIAIIKGLTGIQYNQIIQIINYGNSVNFLFCGPSIYPLEFLVTYVIGPILVVTVLFTAVMMHKSINKAGAFIGIIYVIAIIVVYIYLHSTSLLFSDMLLKYKLIYESVVFLVSIILSYILLNKMIDV